MQYCSFKSREPRRSVRVMASIRSGASRSDAIILNWSSYGMMLSIRSLAARGEYIEIRVGKQSWVARVVWSRDCRIGVRTRERVWLDTEPSRQAGTNQSVALAPARPATWLACLPPSYVAQLLQRTALAIVGIALALGLAAAAHAGLRGVSSSVSSALRQSVESRSAMRIEGTRDQSAKSTSRANPIS